MNFDRIRKFVLSLFLSSALANSQGCFVKSVENLSGVTAEQKSCEKGIGQSILKWTPLSLGTYNMFAVLGRCFLKFDKVWFINSRMGYRPSPIADYNLALGQLWVFPFNLALIGYSFLV